MRIYRSRGSSIVVPFNLNNSVGLLRSTFLNWFVSVVAWLIEDYVVSLMAAAAVSCELFLRYTFFSVATFLI